MIREITIENYKSIETLKLSLGQINIFIGENGCGKSNILEAIALFSASINNKLDNEFLTSRGIRVTENPQLMKSAFSDKSFSKEIKVSVTGEDKVREECILQNDDRSPYPKWIDLGEKKRKNAIMEDEFSTLIHQLSPSDLVKYFAALSPGDLPDEFIDIFKDRLAQRWKNADFVHTSKSFPNTRLNLPDFIIYSPDIVALRTFEKEGQILPLGVNGEGLFKLLKIFNGSKYKNQLEEIKEGLRLIDWFKDFQVPENLSEAEKRLHIQDKYLSRTIKKFDQVSSNEGFLFLLFYFSLFVSDETPKFFAIDNIETSLNPKLSRELMRRLVILTKKHNKQVIFTTHSPSILDGLDLNDDEQKLFVIYRNKLGYTKALPVSKPTIVKGEEPLKLSEEFLRGYLGGLPKNF